VRESKMLIEYVYTCSYSSRRHKCSLREKKTMLLHSTVKQKR